MGAVREPVAGRRLRTWLRFAHTGEVYGLVGQTIAGLVSFGGAVLDVHGAGTGLPAVSRLAVRVRSARRSEVAAGLTPRLTSRGDLGTTDRDHEDHESTN